MGESYMDGDYEVKFVSHSFVAVMICIVKLSCRWNRVAALSRCRNCCLVASHLQLVTILSRGEVTLCIAVHVCASVCMQVDDVGGLLAVACANANNIEASRGLLGFLNTLGGWALRAAHAARSNTIAGATLRCHTL